MAPAQGACGRGCAPVPNSIGGRGLSERSEFRSPNLRDRGKGTRRATPGCPWFWVLLPKQKDLVVRGRNPASIPLPLPQDPGLSRTIRANRDLIFVVAGFSLPSIPLAVSIAGRGASSEALAFLAGILGTPAALSPPVIPDLIGDPESFSCLFVFVCHQGFLLFSCVHLN